MAPSPLMSDLPSYSLATGGISPLTYSLVTLHVFLPSTSIIFLEGQKTHENPNKKSALIKHLVSETVLNGTG